MRSVLNNWLNQVFDEGQWQHFFQSDTHQIRNQFYKEYRFSLYASNSAFQQSFACVCLGVPSNYTLAGVQNGRRISFRRIHHLPGFPVRFYRWLAVPDHQ